MSSLAKTAAEVVNIYRCMKSFEQDGDLLLLEKAIIALGKALEDEAND
jgi:hypothetical protein